MIFKPNPIYGGKESPALGFRTAGVYPQTGQREQKGRLEGGKENLEKKYLFLVRYIGSILEC